MIKLNRGMIKLKCGADSPGIGMMGCASCRDVEDAVPYEAPSKSGRRAGCGKLLLYISGF